MLPCVLGSQWTKPICSLSHVSASSEDALTLFTLFIRVFILDLNNIIQKEGYSHGT